MVLVKRLCICGNEIRFRKGVSAGEHHEVAMCLLNCTKKVTKEWREDTFCGPGRDWTASAWHFIGCPLPFTTDSKENPNSHFLN